MVSPVFLTRVVLRNYNSIAARRTDFDACIAQLRQLAELKIELHARFRQRTMPAPPTASPSIIPAPTRIDRHG